MAASIRQPAAPDRSTLGDLRYWFGPRVASDPAAGPSCVQTCASRRCRATRALS